MNRSVYVSAALTLALITHGSVALGPIMLGPAPARADAPRTAVSVDWSGVTDAAIRRCDLRGLENLVVPYLVEEGYAVVDEVGAMGLTVRMRSSDEAFEVQVASAISVASRRVLIPTPCDASIQLDLIRTIIELAAPMRDALEENAARLAEQAPRASGTEDPRLSTTTRTSSRSQTPPRILLGLGVVFPGTLHPLGTLRFGIALPLEAPLSLTLFVETSATIADRLVLLEPALGAAVRWRAAGDDDLAFVIALEAAVLAHLFIDSKKGDAGGHGDARIGLPIALALGARDLELALVPHLRLARARHEVDGELAFDAAHYGIALRLDVGL